MRRTCDYCGDIIITYATTRGAKTYHNGCYKDIDNGNTKEPPNIQRMGENDKKGD